MLLVLQLRLNGTYWDNSEGVYLATSHAFLHGTSLYDPMVAAQPPPLFLLGGVTLWIHDSLGTVRIVIGLIQLVAAVLSATLVWRLTGNRWAAAAAAPISYLAPWTAREYGTLIPELLAPPLLIGGILLAGRPRALGVVAGVLAFVKVPFLLPAAALVVIARRRRDAGIVALVTFVALWVVSLIVFGGSLWTDVVRAQMQTGHPRVKDLAGVWAQAAWNEIGLLVAAALAWRFRRFLDEPLLRGTLLVTGATALTFLSTWKLGTSLTVLVPIEAMLVPLAVAGVAGAARSRSRAWALAGAVCVAFALVQAVALLSKPEITGQHPFLRPGSQPRYGVNLGKAGVDAAAAAARACPPGVPYSGPPFIAYVARRPMPAGQPDQFLTAKAAVLRDVNARIQAVTRRCPP